ncbi:cytidylate kinase-like family protein [bacterium]|nr:cytidylate kinase-like family protein [bacterium]
MSIVTISRGSYSRGKDVAEKVAERLGYRCISREILAQASGEFHVQQAELLAAIQNPPSFLDRFTFGKERYMAYVRAALLDHFQKNDVVYHGLAGHFFVKAVSHVLKVRIIAEIGDRVELVMEREGMSRDAAAQFLKKLDDERRRWSLHLYGIDTRDPSLYDLVLHIKKLTADDAADIVCHTIDSGRFSPTTESQQALDDLLLAARVRAKLIEDHPRINVSAHSGAVYVGVEGVSSREERTIRESITAIADVRGVEISAIPFVTPD